MSRVFNLFLTAIGAGPLDEPPTCQPVVTASPDARAADEDVNVEPNKIDAEKQIISNAPVETGTTTIEAVQAIWGKKGRWLVIAG